LLKEATRKSFPVEACAIPFGKIAAEEAIVTKIVVAPNILQSSVRFKINLKRLSTPLSELIERAYSS